MKYQVYNRGYKQGCVNASNSESAMRKGALTYNNGNTQGIAVSQWLDLTITAAKEMVGKTIRWQAPAYHMNAGYGGKYQILEILPDNTINGICLDGDDLKYAFIAYNEDYSYTDEDRFVTFYQLD